MKKLLLAFLLLPSLVFAADCPWTVRGAVKTKEDAIRKCGPPDFVNTVGSTQVGNRIIPDEAWIYQNSNGKLTTIVFRGEKVRDFEVR